MASTAEQDRIQVLQRTLYRAAKADPKRRFHALYDKVYRRDVLERASSNVRHNAGAAGIDRTTIADVERYGVDLLLDELAAQLRAGTYRPLPTRRVFIDKHGSKDKRPLSIPAVRDRIVQAAVKIVLEPLFEADFLPCSFGFRPKRGVHDALQVLIDESWRDGAGWLRATSPIVSRRSTAMQLGWASVGESGSVTAGCSSSCGQWYALRGCWTRGASRVE